MAVAPLTVPQILDAQSRASPDRAPLRVEAHTLSYREWDLASRSIAHGILRSGGAPGMRFGLLFDGLDWLAYAAAYLGVLRCGGTAVHLNGHIPETELERRLDECGVSWVIRSPFVSPPDRFLKRCVTVEELLSGDTSPVSVTVAPEAISDIRYTSGTTGPAKAYLVSHANLTFGRTLEGMKDLGRSAVMLVPMTLGTSTSATVLTVALSSPAALVLCSPLDIERMGELIERERVDSVMITPHLASQILEARLAERYDLSSVRVLASASAPLPAAVARKLLASIPGATLQVACAQSEASPALLTHTFAPDRPFSVGKPSSFTEVRIVDERGQELPPGALGEIWLRSPAPKRLFLNAPEVNAQLLADGWHRTGDLGRMDAQGELEFFDRKVDALVSHGELVSSISLEAFLLEHPAVREAAVVGTPHEAGASEIVAFVVLRDPAALAAVREHLSRCVPAEHYPARFVSVVALPRTHNGKVLKRALRLDMGCRTLERLVAPSPDV